ncbi:MAG: alpha/beta fold hydrolase [Gammaproteobacteria bacterium]|nr:alpha/beta fold hydrolase [Gammaproteobacteria bacterium]
MKVFFSHGQESGPQGSKIRHLAALAVALGNRTESLDYTGIGDPDARADLLVSRLREEREDFVLVGSSMGGYVSLAAAESQVPRGLFLLAPALYLEGYRRQSFQPRCPAIEIVHGWSDRSIPPDNSIKFAKQADCTLHLISGDHRLLDSLPAVSALFKAFILALMGDTTIPRSKPKPGGG